MDNYINEDILAPLLEQYIKKSESERNCGYGQMPFIPYVFPCYKSNKFKAFYIGSDTYFWCENDPKYLENPNLYLAENAQYVTEKHFRTDWAKTGSFWGMVGKLHLQLTTGTYHDSIDNLTEDDWKNLRSVGYGNLFPIELPQTLRKKTYNDEKTGVKRNEYEDIVDWSAYRTLRKLAQPFGKLRTIFEAYGEPDVVFVLTWSGSERTFFEGLDYECKCDLYEDGFRSVYLSKTHKTKVIWTSHPNRYHFKSTNPQEMCKYLCDTYYALG